MGSQFYRRESKWGGLEKPVQKWWYLNGPLEDIYDVRNLRLKISGVFENL